MLSYFVSRYFNQHCWFCCCCCIAQLKLDPSTLRQGSRERKNATEQIKKYDTRQDLNPGPRLIASILNSLNYGVSWQNRNFIPYMLSNLQPIPPISFIHVNFDRHFFLTSFFSMNVHSWLYFCMVIFHNLFVVISININEFLQSPVVNGPSNSSPG